MSKGSWLNLAQALIAALHIINGAATMIHLNPVVTVVIGATLAGAQQFTHNEALNTEPPK